MLKMVYNHIGLKGGGKVKREAQPQPRPGENPNMPPTARLSGEPERQAALGLLGRDEAVASRN